MPSRPKPRNVTATEAERIAIVTHAAPALLCWLLLCSDLAIRSGTAAQLGPSSYDSAAGVLRFRTKHGNAQTLPVTARLRSLLDTCTDSELPFVAQLPRGRHWRGGAVLQPLGRMSRDGLYDAFAALKRDHGIRRGVTPHDLRRTTARRVYAQTGDLRAAQGVLGHSDLNSTLWYLQDEITRVTIDQLEAAALHTETVQ